MFTQKEPNVSRQMKETNWLFKDKCIVVFLSNIRVRLTIVNIIYKFDYYKLNLILGCNETFECRFSKRRWWFPYIAVLQSILNVLESLKLFSWFSVFMAMIFGYVLFKMTLISGKIRSTGSAAYVPQQVSKYLMGFV